MAVTKILARISPGPDGSRIVSKNGATTIRFDPKPVTVAVTDALAQRLRGLLGWAEAEIDRPDDPKGKS